MSDSTRRGFVKGSVAAAAGMTVIGALATEQAEADVNAPSGPLVAYVRDTRSGDISVMSGDRSVSIHDRQLAARIARAAR